MPELWCDEHGELYEGEVDEAGNCLICIACDEEPDRDD